MEIVSKMERVTTASVVKVQGVDVNISYERILGKAPFSLSAGATVPGVEGEQPMFLTVTFIVENKQKSTNANGPRGLAEYINLITEIEGVLSQIAIEEGGKA